MRRISGGKMTLSEITNEVIFYINQGVENIVIQVSRDKNGCFYTKIFVGGKDEQLTDGNLSLLSKLS
jgi:hypothetical protein